MAFESSFFCLSSKYFIFHPGRVPFSAKSVGKKLCSQPYDVILLKNCISFFYLSFSCRFVMEVGGSIHPFRANGWIERYEKGL
jgi:hypothetical protein